VTVVRGCKTRPLSLSLPKTPSAAHQRRKAVSMLSGVSGELLREAIVLAIAPYPVGLNDEIGETRCD